MDKKDKSYRNQSKDRQDEITAKDIIRSADLSLNNELDRYDSLSATASRLLTCISILAVALITLIEPLSSACRNTSLVLLFYCIVFFFLIVGFIFAICSQLRFGYQKLESPGMIARRRKDEGHFSSEKEAALCFCDTIEPHYRSLEKRNDSICFCINASMIVLAFDIFLILVFGLVLVCIHCCS